MKTSDHSLNVLTALTYRGIGKAWIVKHLQMVEATTKVVALLNQHAKEDAPVTIDQFESRKISIQSALGLLDATVDGVVAIGDPHFPTYRGLVRNSDRPVTLFYRGDLSLLDSTNRKIAVIGLLTPSRATENIERLVVTSLVERGATIVSGLALGCDTIAHRQALVAGGKTVATLPSSLDEILPQANRDLADEIVSSGGLLVSEYYDKARSKNQLSGRYIERDRLQALFSDCVVLSASYAKNDEGLDSGSRHAMEYARNYSIPRAVIYDLKVHECLRDYDLNRQIKEDDPRVTVISCDATQETLDKIVRQSTTSPEATSSQMELFS
jgi:DNA processing protein